MAEKTVFVQAPDMNIHCYPGALSQALTNLVMNSVSHGFDEPGGEIHLDISAAEEEIIIVYIVPERKPGFFVKVQDGENFNRRNTRRILRIKI
ncbi:MAG: hypothetical protein R6U41_06895 [Desulfosalsimonas sp.]|uniref:hypothetical protein n=1 Tax=Desulfosalsimonas sp. TaxID=3073848 RepID=UPI0039704759